MKMFVYILFFILSRINGVSPVVPTTIQLVSKHMASSATESQPLTSSFIYFSHLFLFLISILLLSLLLSFFFYYYTHFLYSSRLNRDNEP